MWLTGPAAPWHVGSSQTRARTRVPCISRQILNHCTTREAPISFYSNVSLRFPNHSLMMCLLSFSSLKIVNNCPKCLSLFSTFGRLSISSFSNVSRQTQRSYDDSPKGTRSVVVEEGVQPWLLTPDLLTSSSASCCLFKPSVMTFPRVIYDLREVMWISK